MRELEREAELEEKAPKIKAKSKMSKVCIVSYCRYYSESGKEKMWLML